MLRCSVVYFVQRLSTNKWSWMSHGIEIWIKKIVNKVFMSRRHTTKACWRIRMDPNRWNCLLERNLVTRFKLPAVFRSRLIQGNIINHLVVCVLSYLINHLTIRLFHIKSHHGGDVMDVWLTRKITNLSFSFSIKLFK